MTTSGVSTFSLTRDELIREAALKINAIPANSTMPALLVQDFQRAMNSMIARWRAQALHVWKERDVTLFPAVGQARYTMSKTSTDHIAETYFQTELTADAAAAATALTVDSTDDMTALDQIGIVLDDGTLHWSTIASKTSTTVTINAGLASAASSGVAIFNYVGTASMVVRPLRLVDVRRHSFDGLTDVQLEKPIGRNDYNAIPNKASSGQISRVFFDRQLTAGYLNVWQVPSTIDHLLKGTVYLPVDDFTANNDTADLPPEWYDAIIFNLAVVKAPNYNVPPQKLRDLKEMAGEFLAVVALDDREQESVFFQPDYSGHAGG